MAHKALLPSDALGLLSSWVCTSPVLSNKNSRSAFIWADEQRSSPPKIQLCLPEDPCFAVVSVESTESLVYALAKLRTDAQYLFLARLDEYALELAQRKCSEWFGKTLAPEHIKGMYRPLVHQGCVRLRLPDTCNVWKASRNGKSYTDGCPRDLCAGGLLLPCVTLNGIYFKAREMGLSLTCSDALFFEPAVPLPFHLPAAFHESADPLPEHAENTSPAFDGEASNEVFMESGGAR